MGDFLSDMYAWTKAFHIISIITWMAGLFYLPRLFVYHVEQDAAHAPVFEIMEVKLLRVIVNPAMIATWVFGLLLLSTPGVVDWSSLWTWLKLVGVLGLTWFHHWLGRRRKELITGDCTLTGRQFRLMNEVPTVLLVLIVFAVVVKF
mgnify:CR=1 FL=1